MYLSKSKFLFKQFFKFLKNAVPLEHHAMNGPAYFVRAASYTCKIFMKLTTDGNNTSKLYITN
jgi:hypothetical protein